MAIDFPTATTVGQVYTDPTSGNVYTVTVVGPPAQWVGSGSSTNLDSTYLRKDASNDPVTGTLTVTPATNVEGLVVTQPSGNSAAAMRITNEGTGNSLLVEDAASTDSTPFVIQNDGTTLIGATSAVGTSKLQVTGGVQTNALNDGPLAGTRNRIINGDMRIDQRNAGAAQASFSYGLDRWNQEWTSTGVTLSWQQVSEAPTGFNKSLKVTVSTGSASFTFSAAAVQSIEGFNVADFNWGTASAQPVTLSFWVRSSLTGSFGGSLTNANYDRTYPFAYTISAANTWEYKTVTIPGDTTGTWTSDNTVGIKVTFGLGAVAARKAAANVWANSIARQPTGTVDLIATTGATWQVTGVQFEKGSVATEFERRNYGQELFFCQRYFQVWQYPSRDTPIVGQNNGDASVQITPFELPVTMRVYPSSMTYAGSVISGTLRFGTGAGTLVTSAGLNATAIDNTTTPTNRATISFGTRAGWIETAAVRSNHNTDAERPRFYFNSEM